MQKERARLIDQLSYAFTQLHLQGTLVFDGSFRREEISGLCYQWPLDIAYAPKGQSADEYIIEKIQSTQNRKTITIVTNDKGLIRHAKAAGTQVQSNGAFLRWLAQQIQQKKTKPRCSPKEKASEIARLTKIFEQRFLDGPDPTASEK